MFNAIHSTGAMLDHVESLASSLSDLAARSEGKQV
ncbi:MAG: hypothetical protein ACI8PT_001296 [Gammaproteobacteria bacterium]|jgi:hypothetical protein